VSEQQPSRRELLAGLAGTGTATLAGCLGRLDSGGVEGQESDGGSGDGDEARTDAGGELDRLWTAGPTTEYGGNHHKMGATWLGGDPVVGVPHSERPDTPGCGLLALDATGQVRWRRDLPAGSCDPHAVGDVSVGSIDGEAVLLAATIEGTVVAYSAETGDPRFEADLVETIPYSAPVISPELADGSRRIVVVDNTGNVVAARPDGSVAWTHSVEGVVYPAPVVRDVDGDGSVEIVVTTDRKRGWVIALDTAGEVRWEAEFETGGKALSSVGRGDHRDVVLSTWGGEVAAVDGRTGEIRWAETLADRGILGDSDGDRLYASEGSGVVHAVDPVDGTVVWTVDSLGTDAPANAPVVLGGKTSSPTVASLSYDGSLGLIDASGEVLAEHSFGESSYTSPLPVDLTGDGREELLVMFGDGRVEAYEWRA